MVIKGSDSGRPVVDETPTHLPIVDKRGKEIGQTTFDACNYDEFSRFVWHQDKRGEVYTIVGGRRRLMAHVVMDLDHLAEWGEGSHYRTSESPEQKTARLARLRRAYSIWLTNSFNIYDETSSVLPEFVGNGLYPYLSLMEHSCVPNCKQTFNRSIMSVRCLRDIRAGEAVSIDYGGPSTSRSVERRQHLLQQYHFECKCTLCTRQRKE